MKKIRMGMIGGGIGAFIGDAHRRASRICNDYELLGGVFDADPAKSRLFAEQEGIAAGRCYESVEAMIKGEQALPKDQKNRSCRNRHSECPSLYNGKKFLQGRLSCSL